MLDIERLREDPASIEASIARRGVNIDITGTVLPLDRVRLSLTHEIGSLRERRNTLSEQIRGLYTQDGTKPDVEIDALKQEAADLRGVIQSREGELREITSLFNGEMLSIPNTPANHTPDGLDYEDFELVDVWGEKPSISSVEDHSAIGNRLGIIDTIAGTVLSGPRFAVLHGKGAALQRALINFFMDQNTRNGYQEYVVPYLVNPVALEGTGQLPKFQHDLFKTSIGGRDMYLSPTAEVQLTNLVRDRLFDPEELPFKMTAYSENFRAEAGSAGRDMVGIFRQHQFPKLELVRVTDPETSWDELDQLTFDAESCLRSLGLHYRKVALSAGDIGFSSAFTFDLEVWLPGQDKYREVSSCSNFTDFQARRINAKVRNSDGKKEYVHTINGSSLAVGRTMIAIIEQYQQPDGTVKIPESLQDYTKFAEIS